MTGQIGVFGGIVAFISAIVAVFTVVVNAKKIKYDREQWSSEFEARRKQESTEMSIKLAEFAIFFLKEQVTTRFRTYPPVFKLLGIVRDVVEPEENNNHHISLKNDPQQLIQVSDGLRDALYGEAVLVMEMETRNAILDAWNACLRFQQDPTNIETLVKSFFFARRCLRADLQLEDIAGIESRLKKILETMRVEF